MFKRPQGWLISLIITVFVGLSLWDVQGLGSIRATAEADVFEAVWETVNTNFFDHNFNGINWEALGDQYRPRVTRASNLTERAALINEMLAELQTSHTHFYTADEPAYYQLIGIFSRMNTRLQDMFPNGKVEYIGIGTVTQEIEGQTFVKAIFDGSPAATAGLQVGDQILSVAGQPFQPIQSFLDKADQPVTLLIQRTPEPSSQREITVTPKVFDGITMFLDAMNESVQIIEDAGHQIGYVHIWSYAGEQYQQALEEEILYGRLRDADALVLDLRDGWGGAPLTALHVYTGRGPSVRNIFRDGRTYTFHSQWNKPVVMLVNEGSRSAKEILAYAFQQYGIGPLVGAQTPGAVTAGQTFVMPDNNLLYVAVADVYVDEIVRLEGLGVIPDIEIPFPIAYAQGVDPQKEKAIATALELLNP